MVRAIWVMGRWCVVRCRLVDDFEEELFQQFAVGHGAGVVHAFASEVGVAEVADAGGEFVEVVVAGYDVVVFEGVGGHADGLGGVFLVGELDVGHGFGEVGVECGDDHLDGQFFGVGGAVVDDAGAEDDVALGDGFLEFEDVVVFADADVAFDDFVVDGGSCGEGDEELVHFVADVAEVVADVFGDDGGGAFGDGVAVVFDVGGYPGGHLVVARVAAFEDDAFLAEGLVDAGAFVHVFVAVAEDEHGGGLGVVEVGDEGFPFADGDVLGLFDEHELAGREHGVALGGVDDGFHVGVASVDDRLVEVAVFGGHGVLFEIVGDFVDIIVLLAGEEVDGAVLACGQVGQQLSLRDAGGCRHCV